MSDPSPPPRGHNPFGRFGSVAFDAQAFALLMGARNAPVPPTWPADFLRDRLTEIREWVERLPHTGPAVPIAMRRWLHRWPFVPHTHPAYTWMQAIGQNVRWALRLVDEGALDQAQQVYANVKQVMHDLSAELAEPDAALRTKIMQGVSSSGQNRSAGYEPVRQRARAEAHRIKREDPRMSRHAAAKQICKEWKPADKVPSVRRVEDYIEDIIPSRKRSV